MQRAGTAQTAGRKGSVLLAGNRGTDPRDVGRRLAAATGCAMSVVPLDVALATLRPGAQDVVLIDLTDPAAGAALARGIRERHPDLPLVGLVGDAARRDVSAALAAGVSSLVDLEATTAEIGQALGQTMLGRRAVTPGLLEPLLDQLALQGTSEGGAATAEAATADGGATWFMEPGALQSVFQPIADLRDRAIIGYLTLTRFPGFPPQDTARVFERVEAAGVRRELELCAAAEALTHFDSLPEGAWLFLKFRSSTVATGEIDALLGGRLAGRAVIELSENLAETEVDAFWAAVRRLRDKGVRFALDETGLGFGSLGHVFELAPTFVRLPGGLTRDVDSDRTRRALALAVTNFAAQFGAQVVADAVETSEELEALRRLGVHYGIGYHIGRPGPLPTEPGAVPGAGGGEAAREATELLRAPFHVRPETLATMPPRALGSFATAIPPVLRAASDGLPGAVVHVGQPDTLQAVYRFVDLAGPAANGLEPGVGVPIAQSPAALLLAGDLPQLVPDTTREPGCTGLAVLTRLEASSWMCVPLSLPNGTIVASLEASSQQAGRLGFDDLLRLQELAGVLLGSLIAEHGPDDSEAITTTIRATAWRDPLTGLVNAARFAEVLERANARRRGPRDEAQLVLASVLNGLAVAQRMGQGVGDLLVKDVAQSLERHAGPGDVIARIAPYGLACVLLGRNEAQTRRFCEQVEAEVAETGRRRAAMPELRVGHHPLGAGEMTGAVLQLASLHRESAQRT